MLDIAGRGIPLSCLGLAVLIIIDHVNVMILSVLFNWDALILLLVVLILLVVSVLTA
jgi:hypothetical protein